MTAQSCVAPGCNKAGLLACSGCEPPKAWYCSKECQRANFKVHKLTCAPTMPHNCFLIRASSVSGDNQPDMAYIEPFPLESYGDWALEMKELQDRLGWPYAGEAGKFYPPQQDIDTWYYYVYQSSDCSSLPQNKVASICLGRTVFGDVAVVRSSPRGIDDYEKLFTKMDLKRSIEYYKTASPQEVFTEREGSRFARDMGLPDDFLKGVPRFKYEF